MVHNSRAQVNALTHPNIFSHQFEAEGEALPANGEPWKGSQVRHICTIISTWKRYFEIILYLE